MDDDHKFGQLFKTLRLQAGIATLSELGRLLSEKGYIYEDSMLSHWQGGRKIPKSRDVLFALIAIFREKIPDLTHETINEFLEYAQQGYLTESELTQFNLKKKQKAHFLVPPEIEHFVGRTDAIEEITSNIRQRIIIIEGVAGIGKTALAIKMGHLLKEQYPDGVLWFRMDTSNIDTILSTIAHLYKEDINPRFDIDIKSSIVRSLLSTKKALLILDNVENEQQLHLITPNTLSCNVIVTTQKKDLSGKFFHHVLLEEFTSQESYSLFEEILGKDHVGGITEEVGKISNTLHYSPLALSIFINQLKSNILTVSDLSEKLKQEELNLFSLTYQDKDLYSSIKLSLNNLTSECKNIFYSLGVFAGKDFSLDAIRFINQISSIKALEALTMLRNRSFIECSVNKRYRIHPFLLEYVRQQATSESFQRAINFYLEQLKKNASKKEKQDVFIEEELDNIIFLMQKAHKLHFHDEAIALWELFGKFLWEKGYWTMYGNLLKLSYETASRLQGKETLICRYLINLAMCLFWQGNVEASRKYIQKCLTLAKKQKNKLLTAVATKRLAKIYRTEDRYSESLALFQETLAYFEETNDTERIGDTLKDMGENYWLIGEYKLAHAYLFDALGIAKRMNDLPQTAIVLSRLGGLAYSEGDYKHAEEYFKESFAIELGLGRRTSGDIWNNLGLALVHQARGKTKEVKAFLSKAHNEMWHLGVDKRMYKTSVFYIALQDQLENLYRSNV